jgi:hypothetical protein
MIYAVSEGMEYYSFHRNLDEANSYIADLRQVYPDREWELTPLTEGRLEGQRKVIWGAECVVDVFTHEIHQWAKLYLWEGDVFQLPATGELIYKYLPMRFPFTEEVKAAAEIKRRLAGTVWEHEIDSEHARRVK